MENKKQTAVESLKEQLPQIDWNDPFYRGLLQEKKQMEWQQMKDAVLSQCTTNEGLRKIFDKQFEQYYNKTYGK